MVYLLKRFNCTGLATFAIIGVTCWNFFKRSNSIQFQRKAIVFGTRTEYDMPSHFYGGNTPSAQSFQNLLKYLTMGLSQIHRYICLIC